MLGFSDIITNLIQDLRVRELKLSKAYRRLLCLRVFIGKLPVLSSTRKMYCTS